MPSLTRLGPHCWLRCLVLVIMSLGGSCGGPLGSSVLEPQPATNIPPGMKGINHYTLQSETLQLMNQLHPNGQLSIRMPFYWKDVEPAKDQWNLWYNDPFVTLAEPNNVSLLGLLAYSTAWSSSVSTGSADDLYSPPEDPQQFAAYAKSVVARYPQVTHWEVWNEPNLWCFWRPHPDPAQYTQLLKATYTAAKQANRQCTIVLGGLSSGGGWADTIAPQDFLQAVYDAGGKDYFDVVGIHPYNQLQPPGDYLADFIARVRQVMDDHGDSAKPIWITEIGWYTRGDGNAVPEATQADRVTQVFSIVRQYPSVTKVFWYGLQDAGSDPRNPENGYGLFRADGSAKPAVRAFAGL